MKKRAIIICIAVLFAVTLVFVLLPHGSIDTEGYIASVTVTEKSVDEHIVIVRINEDYIRITGETKVVNTDGRSFPAEYFEEGDYIAVYLKKGQTEERVKQAKKVVFDNTK